MNDSFYDIISRILAREGGYVVDPADRGGETYKGISRVHWPDWKGWEYIEEGKDELDRFPGNLSEYPHLDVAVKDFYRSTIWEPSRAEDLPGRYREHYFDMVVNHGQGNAVRILQRGLNAAGAELVVDGVIGKQTIRAAYRNLAADERIAAYRMLFYANIVLKDPSQERFWYGWFRRCNEFTGD